LFRIGNKATDKDHYALDSAAQIKIAQRELANIFPWLDFSAAEFATCRVDRAEPKQKNGLKPDSSYFKSVYNIHIAWPTKLALAPQLSEGIIQTLSAAGLVPLQPDDRYLRSWPVPPIAKAIGEDCFCKDVA
jgi:hypothetical protein